MTLQKAEQIIAEAITGIYEKPEAENIAGILIEFITGLDRTQQVVQKKKEISGNQSMVFQEAVQRLKEYEPIQYIIKEAWFHGLKFFVDERVLIPRPETDELVEKIISYLKETKKNKATILDIGTGSGCIAVSLKKQLPGLSVTAIDESKDALEVARINAESLQTEIEFRQINFTDKKNRAALPAFELIVSNPPYIPEKDKTSMHRNVLDYEPHTALFVPDNNPLLFYEAIAGFAADHLAKGGAIFLEIHEELGDAVKALFDSTSYSAVEIIKDMQGKDRIVKIVR